MPVAFANGIHQNYEIDGDGSPLVFIHGLGFSLRMWNLQVEYFKTLYKVIVYDLRGHGLTDSPNEPYSIGAFSKDLYELLDTLGVKKTAICGLSLGGRIALRFCIEYPERVYSLVLADAQSEVNRETKERLKNLAKIAGETGMDEVTSILYSAPLLEGLAKMNPKRYHWEKEKTAVMSSVGFANSAIAVAEMEPLTSQLGKIAVPTLAVVGEHDDTPYVEFSEIFAERIQGCERKVIPDAGHISNLEQPDVFNQICHDFLAKHGF